MRFPLGPKEVGLGAPCCVVAEIGSNHCGSLERARDMIRVAADAGADAVKFQTFRAERLYPRTAGTSDYLGLETPIYDIIASLEMPEAWIPELSGLSRELGLAFLSSPFHPEAVEVLAPHVDALKVASYELTHEPLIEAVVATDRPLILSCGASTYEETRDAVRRVQAKGLREFVVLQCTAAYPAPPESLSVAALATLREKLGVLTGLSDHSLDPVAAPAAAAALGAVMIEKHFTLSKDDPGPDHPFAVEPDELAALVRAVRSAERARGDGRKRVDAVEDELRDFARRSLFVTRDVDEGETLTTRNVDVLRHGKAGSGLPPRALEAVLGRRARRPLVSGAPLRTDDVAWEGAPPGAEWTESSGDLCLRPAEERDLGLTWAWANDATARLASLVPGPIDYRDHVSWFRATLGGGPRQLWIAETGGEPVAVVRVDEGEDFSEVSLNVAPNRRGEGLGRRTLDALLREAAVSGGRPLGAAILPGHVASRCAFEAVGFQHVGARRLRGVDVDWFERRAPHPTTPAG